jgi:hypothetical protein
MIMTAFVRVAESPFMAHCGLSGVVFHTDLGGRSLLMAVIAKYKPELTGSPHLIQFSG